MSASAINRLPKGILERFGCGEIQLDEFIAEAYLKTTKQVQRFFAEDEIINRNPFTERIRLHGFNVEQLKAWGIQFGGFSNFFKLAEFQRLVWGVGTPTEEASLEIILSEEGVAPDMTTNEIEGQVYHQHDRHINMLRDMLEPLGVLRSIVGRRDTLTDDTKYFIDVGLLDAYGSDKPSKRVGASNLIEGWAGRFLNTPQEHKNFWIEHREALKRFNKEYRINKELAPLPIGFFEEHIRIELFHVATVEGLFDKVFFELWFDLDDWWEGFRQASDGLSRFWHGLARQWDELQ